jgi:hypothetical protein
VFRRERAFIDAVNELLAIHRKSPLCRPMKRLMKVGCLRASRRFELRQCYAFLVRSTNRDVSGEGGISCGHQSSLPSIFRNKQPLSEPVVSARQPLSLRDRIRFSRRRRSTAYIDDTAPAVSCRRRSSAVHSLDESAAGAVRTLARCRRRVRDALKCGREAWFCGGDVLAGVSLKSVLETGY